ncbi:MAG: hypothetical protein D6718_05615 [Acidobacteria bacterium]|nr:MAG: hypothetical protein D6718_05615 [Acidobacteriota bacterium]
MSLWRRWAGAGALAGAIVLWAGCTTPAARPGALPVSPKLNPFVYYEDGRVLFIAVDGRAAQYQKHEPVFPLGIALANQSAGPLTFARESFTLETETGQQYPTIGHREFLETYHRSRRDVRLADAFQDILFARFQNLYAPVAWRLFPFSGETSAVQERVELGRRQLTWGYLYFPVPPEGIHRKRFTLLVRPVNHPETYVVRFALR